MNLNLALLDLAGAERISGGFLVHSQPALRCCEVEQHNQHRTTVLVRDEIDAQPINPTRHNRSRGDGDRAAFLKRTV